MCLFLRGIFVCRLRVEGIILYYSFLKKGNCGLLLGRLLINDKLVIVHCRGGFNPKAGSTVITYK